MKKEIEEKMKFEDILVLDNWDIDFKKSQKKLDKIFAQEKQKERNACIKEHSFKCCQILRKEKQKWAKKILKIVEEQLAEIQNWTEETAGKSTFNIGAEMKKLKQKLKKLNKKR